MGGLRPPAGGFLRIHRREGKQPRPEDFERAITAHPPARGQANAVLDERLLGVGVDPRVDRLVADRVALSVGGSIHGGQCATRLLTQAVR